MDIACYSYVISTMWWNLLSVKFASTSLYHSPIKYFLEKPSRSHWVPKETASPTTKWWHNQESCLPFSSKIWINSLQSLLQVAQNVCFVTLAIKLSPVYLLEQENIIEMARHVTISLYLKAAEKGQSCSNTDTGAVIIKSSLLLAIQGFFTVIIVSLLFWKPL